MQLRDCDSWSRSLWKLQIVSQSKVVRFTFLEDDAKWKVHWMFTRGKKISWWVGCYEWPSTKSKAWAWSFVWRPYVCDSKVMKTIHVHLPLYFSSLRVWTLFLRLNLFSFYCWFCYYLLRISTMLNGITVHMIETCLLLGACAPLRRRHMLNPFSWLYWWLRCKDME